MQRYAKTLYKPELPHDLQTNIHNLTKFKTPHFFIYAKGKTEEQVDPINSSTVNRICALIPKVRLRNTERTKSAFDYKMLMDNPDAVATDKIVAEYNALYNRFSRQFKDWDETTAFGHVRTESINALSSIAGSPVKACDMLVRQLFDNSKSIKQRLFWICFGDIVLGNLERNLVGTMYCSKCGARITRESNRQKLCVDCSCYVKLGIREVVCVECRRVFESPPHEKMRKLCDTCRRIKKKERQLRYIENKLKKTQ